MNQGNAFGAGFNPAAHPVIPKFHAGTGDGIRTLGINQKLVVKRVFIDSGRRFQIPHPAVSVFRNSIGGFSCKCGNPL
jgi:hypothetical protein